MQRRAVKRRSVPIKTRGVDPREVDGQPLRTMRKTARVNGLCRCVGGGSSQSKGVRGRRRQRGPTNDRSGIAGKHGSYRQARRDQRALQGTRTSREASGRSCGTVSRRTCAAMTCTACTRPDRRRRLGYAVPERAVAGRCVEAQADVARPSRGRLTQRGPARQPDDPKAAQANTAARSSGGVSDRPPNARTRRTIGSATTRTLSGDQS
jgi:hypothetical protein